MKTWLSHDKIQSEAALILFLKQNIPRYGATLGIGDDAAIISATGKDSVVTTDSLIENVHFKGSWVTPLYLGKKAARANLSDIAAMGATPSYALVSLVLPHNWFRKSIISELYDGFLWAFAPHKVEIIGGNVSSGEKISITLTLLGTLEGKPLLRSGARVGDIIFCSGAIGAAANEVSLLLAGKKEDMEVIPPDRIEFAKKLATKNLATACIDISDGLVLDLARFCNESSVGASIMENTIPIAHASVSSEKLMQFAFDGGEDYELLFTAKKEDALKVRRLGGQLKTRVTQIGETVGQSGGVTIVDKQGKTHALLPQGWDHVSAARRG